MKVIFEINAYLYKTRDEIPFKLLPKKAMPRNWLCRNKNVMTYYNFYLSYSTKTDTKAPFYVWDGYRCKI